MAEKKQLMCEIHSKDIDELREEVDKINDNSYKMNLKLESILEKIKPPFSSGDKIKVIGALITYTFLVGSFMLNTDNVAKKNTDSIDQLKIENKETINELRIEKKETQQKIDKIYDIVVQTNQDVAVLKSK